MGIQKKILQRAKSVSVKKISGSTEVDATLTGYVGTLALGKPGDIITRAYGPVVRAAVLTSDAAFGTYVEGKGILVNSGDCEAIGMKLDAVTVLKKGQVGSFLVSGACVVEGKEVQAIANAMNVQYLDPDFTIGESHTTDTNVYEIEVNGFDNDVDPSQA